MSLQLTDADTPETLAGVVRLLRRAAKLAWAAVDADGTGSPRQVLALGIDLAADEARNLLPDDIGVEGPVRRRCNGRSPTLRRAVAAAHRGRSLLSRCP